MPIVIVEGRFSIGATLDRKEKQYINRIQTVEWEEAKMAEDARGSRCASRRLGPSGRIRRRGYNNIIEEPTMSTTLTLLQRHGGGMRK